MIADLSDIRPGLHPDDQWKVLPGTFLADFELEETLGGQNEPVTTPETEGNLLTVAIPISIPAHDVPDTLETLRRHIGERYLLFLTPELQMEGTESIPTGRYSLAYYAAAPMLQIDERNGVVPIPVASELIEEAVARGERLTSTSDPTRSERRRSATLEERLERTIVGELLGASQDELVAEWSGPIGRPINEIEMEGHEASIQTILELNQDLGPAAQPIE